MRDTDINYWLLVIILFGSIIADVLIVKGLSRMGLDDDYCFFLGGGILCLWFSFLGSPSRELEKRRKLANKNKTEVR